MKFIIPICSFLPGGIRMLEVISEFLLVDMYRGTGFHPEL
jgi:hypothetical protein